MVYTNIFTVLINNKYMPIHFYIYLKIKGITSALYRSSTLFELNGRPAYFKIVWVNIRRGERGISSRLHIYYIVIIAEGEHYSKCFTSVNLVIILSFRYG